MAKSALHLPIRRALIWGLGGMIEELSASRRSQLTALYQAFVAERSAERRYKVKVRAKRRWNVVSLFLCFVLSAAL